MSYIKTIWVNDSSPYLSAANLNKIEQGIETAHDDISTINTNLTTLTNRISTVETNVSINSNTINSINSAISTINTNLNTKITGVQFQDTSHPLNSYALSAGSYMCLNSSGDWVYNQSVGPYIITKEGWYPISIGYNTNNRYITCNNITITSDTIGQAKVRLSFANITDAAHSAESPSITIKWMRLLFN